MDHKHVKKNINTILNTKWYKNSNFYYKNTVTNITVKTVKKTKNQYNLIKRASFLNVNYWVPLGYNGCSQFYDYNQQTCKPITNQF